MEVEKEQIGGLKTGKGVKEPAQYGEAVIPAKLGQPPVGQASCSHVFQCIKKNDEVRKAAFWKKKCDPEKGASQIIESEAGNQRRP